MLSNGGYRIYQYIIIQIYLQLSTYMYIEIVCQIAMLYDDNTIFSDCFFFFWGGEGRGRCWWYYHLFEASNFHILLRWIDHLQKLNPQNMCACVHVSVKIEPLENFPLYGIAHATSAKIAPFHAWVIQLLDTTTPLQVQLLLCYAQSDTRKVIRLMALKELQKLVSEVPHTWTKDMVHVS